MKDEEMNFKKNCECEKISSPPRPHSRSARINEGSGPERLVLGEKKFQWLEFNSILNFNSSFKNFLNL